jgi:lincosamide nucleotidyltransferase A/C/D/E
MAFTRARHRVMRAGYRLVAHSPLRPILKTGIVKRLKRRSLEMPATGVPEAVDALTRAGVRAWVVGGWGVDALLGEHTRQHRDLDLVIDAGSGSENRAIEALSTIGYRFVKREAVPDSDPSSWLSTRIVMADDSGHVIDLHPVTFPLLVVHGSYRGSFTVEEAFTRGVVAGRAVPCLSAPLQLALHKGYEPDEADLKDVPLLLARIDELRGAGARSDDSESGAASG